MKAAQGADAFTVLKICLAYGALKEDILLVMPIGHFEIATRQIVQIIFGQNWCFAAAFRLIKLFILKKLFLFGNTRNKLALYHFLVDQMSDGMILQLFLFHLLLAELASNKTRITHRHLAPVHVVGQHAAWKLLEADRALGRLLLAEVGDMLLIF